MVYLSGKFVVFSELIVHEQPLCIFICSQNWVCKLPMWNHTVVVSIKPPADILQRLNIMLKRGFIQFVITPKNNDLKTESTQYYATIVISFLHFFLQLRWPTHWAQIFTGLLFYAYVVIHQVRILWQLAKVYPTVNYDYVIPFNWQCANFLRNAKTHLNNDLFI